MINLFLAGRWKIARFIIFIVICLPALQCTKETQKRSVTEEPQKNNPKQIVKIEQTGTPRARLAKKGMCSAYTLTLVKGAIDLRLVDSIWTNPFTQEKYSYAFGVENFCDFDDRINEGDEFNFEVVETGNKNCVNCAAAYPYPQKRLNIKVLEVFRKS
ncbi:hypothetical protein LL912_13570 [Niabella sp. CC-SYL272]|uniref:hypothetical protein n=1 Tax=Niabella agricola TaxID=2891571 RepID=UPI001F2D0965|nr:hypothetical protein [Niabella agricola]MCF3109803.1 hypothetical protein [Niabella agricola]